MVEGDRPLRGDAWRAVLRSEDGEVCVGDAKLGVELAGSSTSSGTNLLNAGILVGHEDVEEERSQHWHVIKTLPL
jgi:hypothetical protein